MATTAQTSEVEIGRERETHNNAYYQKTHPTHRIQHRHKEKQQTHHTHHKPKEIHQQTQEHITQDGAPTNATHFCDTEAKELHRMATQIPQTPPYHH